MAYDSARALAASNAGPGPAVCGGAAFLSGVELEGELSALPLLLPPATVPPHPA
jgi:hypothetical protein